MKKPDLVHVVTVLAIMVVTYGLLFPAGIGRQRAPGRTEAKAAVVNIVAALRAYYTEYGKWPDYTGDGLFLDGLRNAQLMRTLRAQDETNNPRKIVFFEGRTATKQGWSGARYGGGFNPETGAFLDTWGNPYRITIDARGDYTIPNPYTDDGPIHTSVIVWSLGKDGQQGAPANPRTFKGSDDMTSWQ